MEKSLFEQMGGTYRRVGDYYLPNLELPDEPEIEIGIWGERRRRYLREHKNGIYTGMLITGKLNSHLAEIDKQADELFFRLVKQLAEKEGVTEKLKAENQMEWVGRMNDIRSRVTEIVNTDLIFS